jgi:hypothetical protein
MFYVFIKYAKLWELQLKKPSSIPSPLGFESQRLAGETPSIPSLLVGEGKGEGGGALG